ncbi:MAG: hypothetical protein J0M10_00700 [Chitinophagales bacterium]|nr:hypothetical protein [Chitinophagales bacterium]
MKRKSVYPAILALVFFIACKEAEQETGPVPASAITTPVPAPAPVQAPVPSTQVEATGSKTGVALNPAHGQPGHRCEIPVGAPLDSKPSAPAINTIQQPAAVSTPAPAPVNTTTASGLNPAHGQPGHRCDIAVGAPLNSKPSN